MTQGTIYVATEIQVLEGMEAIRKRPAMYAGPLDEMCPNRLVQETLCKTFSDACEGKTTRLDVHIGAKGSFGVTDNGPGWSVAMRRNGVTYAEELMTALFACKAEKSEETRGLCNHGVVAVNALSSDGTLTTWTDNFEWTQFYEKGRPLGPIKRTGWVGRSGVHLGFKLDETLLPHVEIQTESLLAHIRDTKPSSLFVTLWDARVQREFQIR